MGQWSHGTVESWDVPSWNPAAPVQKIVEGPQELQGKWIVRKEVAGFGPERFARYDIINKTVNTTTIEKYPSRDKLEIADKNASLVNISSCTISDICTNLYYTTFRVFFRTKKSR